MTVLTANAIAATTTLSWDPPTNPDGTAISEIAGYKIQMGTAPQTYSQTIDVGNVTTYTLNNLSDGTTYYFAATDYDGAGNESGNSNEVSKTFPVTYTLTATSGIGGSITPVGTVSASQATSGTTVITSVTVNQGVSQSFAIAASSGYHIADVTVDGYSVGPVTSYTFSNITANHTLAATFATSTSPTTYTVAASTGTGGSITPSGTITVNSGTSQTFSIIPATGYAISDVKVDGSSVGTVSSYTFNNITASHTIAATFSQTVYTISASAGTGGSISPSGSTSYYYGTSQVYTITPLAGYKIASVIVDGANVGAVSSYTFSNISANHTISSSYAPTTTSIDTNMAPAATVTASSEDTSTGQLAIKAVDGKISGYPSDYTAEWVTVGQLAGAWIRLAWSQPITISKIVLYDRPNLTDQVTAGTLTFSDGSTVKVGRLYNNGSATTISIPPRTASWVKFTVSKATGTNIGLSEFQVFGH